MEHINFDALGRDELWSLRNEVVLNSLFIHDYDNSLGYDPEDICEFFDGYLDYLSELSGEKDIEKLIEKHDNPDNLWAWKLCCTDFSWMRYAVTEY